MEQVVLVQGCPLRNGTHHPVKVPQVVGIAVAPPISLVSVVCAATGNPAVGVGIIRRVIQRPESIMPGLKVARLWIIKSIDRRPASCSASIPRTRTAATLISMNEVGTMLLVDGPGTKERPQPLVVPHPVDQMPHMGDPMGVNGCRIRAG